MTTTPQSVEAAIATFDFPQTYFYNGTGFDPKDTLRRFAAALAATSHIAPDAAAIQADFDALRQPIIDTLTAHRMVRMFEVEDEGLGNSYPLIDRLSLDGAGDIESGAVEIEAITDAVLDTIAKEFMGIPQMIHARNCLCSKCLQEFAASEVTASPAIAPEASELPPTDALAEVHAFLLGEGPLDGFHFGDSDTERPKKRYWWRDNLRAAIAMHQAATARDEQPKLVLALPDYDKRQIIIASDEVIDGERIVCVGIKDLAAAEPVPTSEAARKNLELAIARLEQIAECVHMDEIENMAKEALVCAQTLATKPATGSPARIRHLEHERDLARSAAKHEAENADMWRKRALSLEPMPASEAASERAMFEAETPGLNHQRVSDDDSDSSYRSRVVEDLWQGWEMRARLAAPAAPTDAKPDQNEFERQAAYQGARNFTLALGMKCANGWFPATYACPETELAWRVWANKRAAAPTDAGVRDKALGEAASIAITLTKVPGDLMGQPNDAMLRVATAGRRIADAILALKSSPQAPKTEGSGGS